tara:strand:- start:751 stop:1392 length:642 start_codon:yes stop_codon:yes gene_type:complete
MSADISAVERLEIPQQNLKSINVKIVGTSELIVHRFSEKALKMIEDIQAKKARTLSKRNPKKEYEDCFYRWGKGNVNAWNYPDEWDGESTGVPSIAIKKAMVTAVSQITGVTKVLARQAFHVDGEILKVENAEPYMRSDHVRIGIKQTDIRYRPAYPAGWTIDVPITFDADVISLEQLMNLLERAGFSVGLCEHRPEKDGHYGTFTIDKTQSE